ncbi:adenylate/guanylate cyclase domain-containing protein [Armatimonas sp.]|uniref:adenylate/guanylate cyclase domain-containing protein n=1 Tax=Armatimonas sp. TaxID=1872638 RepID=UPI0037534D70
MAETLPKWPKGRVTFLFTDIKDSTVRAQTYGDLVYDAQLRGPHHERLRSVIHVHTGRFFQDKGDGVVAVFEHPTDAVACALALQRSFRDDPIRVGESGPPLTVRMGLNTAPEDQNLHPDDPERPQYLANALNYCSRVEGPADAGQILLSDETKSGLMVGFEQTYNATFHPWPGRKLKSYSRGHTLWDVLYDGREPKEPGTPWIPLSALSPRRAGVRGVTEARGARRASRHPPAPPPTGLFAQSAAPRLYRAV